MLCRWFTPSLWRSTARPHLRWMIVRLRDTLSHPGGIVCRLANPRGGERGGASCYHGVTGHHMTTLADLFTSAYGKDGGRVCDMEWRLRRGDYTHGQPASRRSGRSGWTAYSASDA